jgi:hypothetical protein
MSLSAHRAWMLALAGAGVLACRGDEPIADVDATTQTQTGSGDGDGDGDSSDGDGDSGDGDSSDGDGDSGDGDGDSGDGDGDGDSGDGDGDMPECVPEAFVHAPAPRIVDGLDAVPIDILDLDASIEFDVGNQSAHAEVTLTFQLGPAAGQPILDLRQVHGSLLLDGEPIDNELLARHDFGKGWDAGFAVLATPLDPCTIHTLELDYAVALPQAPGAGGLAYGQEPARLWFDLYSSDLNPGRYLESWLPANMPWDRHAVHLGLSLVGAQVSHTVLSNADVEPLDVNAWQLEFPDTTTAMAPMIVIKPSEELSLAAGVHAAANGQDIAYEVWTDQTLATPPASYAADLVAWLDEIVLSTGDYPHPRVTAYLYQTDRSMEYAGATTSSPIALEHELFHSWWARGLEPATYADGWIDEAWAMFNTTPNIEFVPVALDWNAAPVQLYDPHPFARDTPDASYANGLLLFAGLAEIMGLDPLREAMADLFTQGSWPRSITTIELEQHLHCASGEDPQVRQAFHRFVYGMVGEPDVAPPCP